MTTDHRPIWALQALLLACLSLLVGQACSTTGGGRRARSGYSERGIASWYGPGFHGRATASGESYDMNAMTAAHRTLPFGTVVRVTHRENGRRVEVRINDRGPFVGGRIIDLSRKAAKQLDMIGSGTAPVEIRVIGLVPPAAGSYWVQVGAFRDRERARTLAQRLRSDYPQIRVETDGSWHRVRLGPFERRKEAERARRRLSREGIDAVLAVVS